MLITFLDDSVSFDGNSGIERALGGPEKALVALAKALCVGVVILFGFLIAVPQPPLWMV